MVVNSMFEWLELSSVLFQQWGKVLMFLTFGLWLQQNELNECWCVHHLPSLPGLASVQYGWLFESKTVVICLKPIQQFNTKAPWSLGIVDELLPLWLWGGSWGHYRNAKLFHGWANGWLVRQVGIACIVCFFCRNSVLPMCGPGIELERSIITLACRQLF